MKSPQQLVGELILLAAGVLLVVGFGYFAGGWIIDLIRQPVVDALDHATAANGSLRTENERLVEQNARLDRLLTERGEFERRVDQRLGNVEKGLKGLKARDPKVREWAETRIPNAVLELKAQ